MNNDFEDLRGRQTHRLRPLVCVSKRGIKVVSFLDRSHFLHAGGFMEFTAESSATDVRMKTNQPQLTPDVRLGSSKAAVETNDTEAGVRYNISFSRGCREGGSWQTTESFASDHLRWLGIMTVRTLPWIFAQGLERDSTDESTLFPQAEED